MGRRSLPTQLKVTRGTLRPDRANPDEPTPGSVLLVAPDWLSESAKEAFTELSKLLHGQRVLTEMDGMALTLLCDQWAIYREARDFIAENGQYSVCEDKLGNVVYKNYPQLTTLTASYTNVMRTLSEFGLTPASRTRVSSLTSEEEEDPLEKLLREAAQSRQRIGQNAS